MEVVLKTCLPPREGFGGHKVGTGKEQSSCVPWPDLTAHAHLSHSSLALARSC